MWLMNAFVALFVSVLLYCGFSYLLEDVIDLRMESTNGIILFVMIFVFAYKGADYLTKGY